MKAVFLAPFTGVDPTERRIARQVGAIADRICKTCGLQLIHAWWDPDGNPRTDFSNVWESDIEVLWTSALAIVLEGRSTGIGIQVAWIQTFVRSMILLTPSGTPKSPLLHGIPLRMLSRIEFDAIDQLEKDLTTRILELRPQLYSAREKLRQVIRNRSNPVGDWLRREREHRNLTHEELAEQSGLDAKWIQDIETKPWAMWGLSVGELLLLSKALGDLPWFLSPTTSTGSIRNSDMQLIEEAAFLDNWPTRNKAHFALTYRHLFSQSEGSHLTVDAVRQLYKEFLKGNPA